MGPQGVLTGAGYTGGESPRVLAGGGGVRAAMQGRLRWAPGTVPPPQPVWAPTPSPSPDMSCQHSPRPRSSKRSLLGRPWDQSGTGGVTQSPPLRLVTDEVVPYLLSRKPPVRSHLAWWQGGLAHSGRSVDGDGKEGETGGREAWTERMSERGGGI